VIFEADYDEIKLQKYSYDIISVMSLPFYHQNNVTKIFPIWATPNKNFWLCQWSWVKNLMVFKKVVLVL